MHRQDSGRNTRARTAAQDPKTQLSATYRMMPATPASAGVVILDFLPPPNSPSKEHTDKAWAKYRGACSHPGPQPLRIPNPYNDNQVRHCTPASAGVWQSWSRFFLPLFEEHTDNIHHEIRERTAAQTPTCNLYDNETRTAPHTRFGGDLHAAISDPMNAPTRRRAKRRSAQLPRPPTFDYPQCNLYDYATNTVPHTRRKYTDNAHPEIRERAATQDPNPRPSASYRMTDQIRCHTPTEAGVWQYYVLSPYVKPHPKPAQMKAKAKYGRTQAPESPAPNTHGDHHDELNTIPYAAAAGVWSFLPPRNFTHPRIHRQGPGRNMGARTATQDDPQASLHNDELNTVPHARFGGCVALLGFLPPRNLHAMNALTRPGQTTGARTATQDSNARLSTTNTTTNRIWCHTPAKAGTFSHCETPPKASTDEAQGEIPTYVATRKPSNRNEKLNMIPHTR
ncbi:hypothetical protein BS47DRAFT_1366549 [Hydnum rufescens UP504]|uniref:Uncharacterized protein n=1 Tax=Hydnum rufescens UP504 TaxID=1448309 RepID=A0A9P6DQM7_9AGAM|nr:hypothetical protein BS47DRAFT_1366549 [Hydnum rufescens UP504]